MHIGYTFQCPFDTIAIIICQGRIVIDRPVVTSITVNRTIFTCYFPPIVLGRIAVTNNLIKAAFDHCRELFFTLAFIHVYFTINAIVELLTHQQIRLALILLIEMRHAPSGFDVDALHGQAPPVAYITRTAVAAVLQSGRSSDTCSALGGLERIRKGCRSVLVCGGRFYLMNACARVGSFKLADTRGDIVLCFGTLWNLDDTVDDIRKV